MKSSILSYLMSMLNENNTSETFATQLGENSNNIKGALSTLVPTILGGFMNKASSNPSSAQQIFDLATEGGNSGFLSNLSSGILGGAFQDKSSNLLGSLFGSGLLDKLTGSIASNNSLKTSSASSLIKWIAPIVLSGLGKFISSKNLNLSSLLSLFNSEKNDINSAIPTNLNFFSNAQERIDNVRETVTNTTHHASQTANQYVEEKKKSNILLPLILLALLAGILWWAMKGCNKNEEVTVVNTDTAVTTTTTTTTTTITTPSWKWNDDSTITYEVGDLSWNLLPNGDSVEIASNGSEMLLIDKIKTALATGLDESEEGKAAGWINLYDIQFTKGTTYRAGAEKQIENIAKILKAYPNVVIKLGGYTDNTGSDDINKPLSQKRADKVLADLKAKGIESQLDKAEGYGSEHPIAENETAEGRAQNRRVSARIVAIK